MILRINPGSFDPSFVGIEFGLVKKRVHHKLADLTSLDLTKVRLATNAEMKANKKLIPLNADIFMAFWENQNLIPQEWKENVDGKSTTVYFDGTEITDKFRRRQVICMWWYNRWKWGYTDAYNRSIGTTYPASVCLAAVYES